MADLRKKQGAYPAEFTPSLSEAHRSAISGSLVPSFLGRDQHSLVKAMDLTVDAAQAHIEEALAEATGASHIGFAQPGTGAVLRTLQEKAEEVVSVKDFGAVGDGVTNDTNAFTAAAASGVEVSVPPGSYNLTSNVTGYWRVAQQVSYTGAGRPLQQERGFWVDEGGANIHRFRDRAFFGDGVAYTGRRTAPYGGSWMTEFGASYFEKNAQVTVLSSESGGRIGLMAGSRTEPGVASLVNMGIGAFSLNEGVDSTGRAFYAEAFSKGTATATYGIEVQGGDFTAVDHVAGAYLVDGGYIGAYLAVEAGHNYTVGDADTVIAAPTKPGNLAIDISGGTLSGESGNYRWRTGIVFRNGSLYRGTVDGLSGTAKAISMAQQHEIVWEASSTIRGAYLRSDVTAVENQDVGIVFGNNVVQIMGTAAFPILEMARDAAGAGAVNNAKFTNGRTGISPKLNAQGADANVGLDLQTKGAGVIRFLGQAGASESLRLQFSGSYVNFLTGTGSVAAGAVTLGAGGSDANIDIALTPKGTGNLRFGTFTVNADAPITGYITIKDSGGTLRKLAVIA